MNGHLEILPLKEWGLFTEPGPCVLAGPCSAETEEQVMDTAMQLKSIGVDVFRAGIWKPRTHPGSFEGVGTSGLSWLRRVQEELGMKTAVEVACREHVEACLEAGVDLLWIGARTTVNPFLVQEIADALEGNDKAVLVKNPLAQDLELWIGAVERLHEAGLRKIGVIHRGFPSAEPAPYRNPPQWKTVIEMRRRYPDLPMFCDPSHIAGCRDYIADLSQNAMDLGFDGLMVEVHRDPSCAWSDAGQQLTPAAFQDMLEHLEVRSVDTDSAALKDDIHVLRAKIDAIDDELLRLLQERMEVSARIGQCKKAGNITILQTSRWDEVLSKMVADGKASGLDEKMIVEIFSAIHEASIRVQNKIISGR